MQAISRKFTQRNTSLVVYPSSSRIKRRSQNHRTLFAKRPQTRRTPLIVNEHFIETPPPKCSQVLRNSQSSEPVPAGDLSLLIRRFEYASQAGRLFE